MRGIVKCRLCRRALCYIRSNEQTGVKTAKYYCRNHTGTKATGEPLKKRPEITEDEMKRRIVEACNACVDSIESGEPIMVLAKEDNRWYSALELKDYLTELKEQKEAAWTEHTLWYDKFCSEEITKEEFIVHRDEWEENKARLETQIRMAMIMENRVSIADNLRRDMKGKLSKLTEFDPERVKSMVDKVLLDPDGVLKVVFVEGLAEISETKVEGNAHHLNTR